MIDFAGWAMPLSYGSQIAEHHAVRKSCGVFDVSHMRTVDISGQGSAALLRLLLANDVAKIRQDGQAMYSCMLNPEGGVIDDLIIYKQSDTRWRTVLNAATAMADLDWIRRNIHEVQLSVDVLERTDLSMLAIQGPLALDAVARVWPSRADRLADLPPFHSLLLPGDVFIARTGYTGEDGLEISLPSHEAEALWSALLAAGVQPCGLGARDTLRLEAALNLSGQDMDESVSPYESGLGWTVSMHDPDREFIGRDALEISPRDRHRIGIRLLDRGVMRSGMRVRASHGEGEITSGSMSPALGYSIALARMPGQNEPGQPVQVCIRDTWLSAEVVPLPFVKRTPA